MNVLRTLYTNVTMFLRACDGEGRRVRVIAREGRHSLHSMHTAQLHSNPLALTPKACSASFHGRCTCTYGFQCSLDILYSELNMIGMMTSVLCSINPTTYSLFHRYSALSAT